MENSLFFSLGQEGEIFVFSILLGGFFGAVYDLFRCVRAGFPGIHTKLLVFVEDFVYMLFCSLCYFMFVMILAGGHIRFYIFAANLTGFMLWHYTLGNLAVTAVRVTVRFVKKHILKPLFGVIIRPFSAVFSKILTKIKNLFCAMLQNNRKNKKSRKKTLQVDAAVVYNNV